LGGLSQKVEGPYALYVFVGLQPWMFFANAVTLAANSLLGSGHLISKVYFPRLLVPVSAIASGLVDFAVGFLFLLFLLGAYGVKLSRGFVTFPLFLTGTLVSAIGAGILFAALIITYRDFRYVVPFLVQVWLFATPVLYPISVVPARWRPLWALNPLVGMISGFRSAILGEPFEAGVILISTVTAAVVLVAGIQYFLQVERRFADII
jgi:lipopolysaccharide transport system permease protein